MSNTQENHYVMYYIHHNINYDIDEIYHKTLIHQVMVNVFCVYLLLMDWTVNSVIITNLNLIRMMMLYRNIIHHVAIK